MGSIRSVLWIGAADDLMTTLASRSPTLDIVWEREVRPGLCLGREAFDAVVVDTKAAPALEVVRTLSRDSNAPVLVRVSPQEADRADALRRAGATRVVRRGDADQEQSLLGQIERLIAARRSGPAARHGEIIGSGPAMTRALSLVRVAARSRATVLLSGETGTGKEVVAKAVHRLSARRKASFVAVNCAAFPDALLESELFGHVRGAFTGADRDKAGVFESAQGGTLFLDEVSETSRPFQAKMLRALQEREVRRIGGTRTQAIDVRVVAASNRDLLREVEEKRFREDLYYRLAVFPIHLPPLRERPEDVVPLAHHFLAQHGASEEKPGVALSDEAQRLLLAHPWPGNVRELENQMQRALALVEPGELLTREHLSERLGAFLEPIETRIQAGDNLHETLARVEAYLIRCALDDHQGLRSATARALGVTREGLYKKMKRLGIA